MSAPIQKLAKFSRDIFSKINSDQNFPEKLKQLRLMVNKITAKDVGFDIEQLKHLETHGQEDVAPVTYVKLWEDDIFTMGIFVVKPGGRLPLHDHPGMYGFCKVIHGEMNVTSFNPVKPKETEADEIPGEILEKLRPWQIQLTKKVQLNCDRSFTTSDECCFLNPQLGNIHELKPVGNTSAFLDILAPPYDHYRTGQRECHYFEDLSEGVGDFRWLIQTHQPLDFWCDSLQYFGPTIDLPSLSPRT